jgi:hypothetical protein
MDLGQIDDTQRAPTGRLAGAGRSGSTFGDPAAAGQGQTGAQTQFAKAAGDATKDTLGKALGGESKTEVGPRERWVCLGGPLGSAACEVSNRMGMSVPMSDESKVRLKLATYGLVSLCCQCVGGCLPVPGLAARMRPR